MNDDTARNVKDVIAKTNNVATNNPTDAQFIINRDKHNWGNR